MKFSPPPPSDEVTAQICTARGGILYINTLYVSIGYALVLYKITLCLPRYYEALHNIHTRLYVILVLYLTI